MKKFQAKCKNAYLIKLLAEVLNNNLKTGCFEFNKDGIYLKMMDDRKHILIDISLPKDQFYLYNYAFKTTQHIGVNLCHLYKMIKSVKKKDTIEIFIDSEDLTDLGIKVTSNNSTRTSCSFIKIQSIQNLEIESPSGYSYTYLIPSSNFGKMCKEMYSIDSKIDIVATKYKIIFKTDAGGIMKKHIEFGENPDVKDVLIKTVVFNKTYKTEQLNRLCKIAGFSTDMHICIDNDMPLLLKSSIGALGTISIYIKDNQQLEVEQLYNN